ncbi:hypothetical protein [Streptomyces sp. H34-S4]|uniref:hypothetical protein n=1 Tax=Streptomyces sp. H34-S4 TaxID=2996463 RepID=UPI00226E6D76|nr:hypothetical protein [Streptomyces sp. H34-S4]MCY0939572.1 hypothetical protein [Streptomyces sp. H34-S4]
MNKRTTAVLCTVTALGAVLAVPTAAHAADPFPEGFTTSAKDERVSVFFGWDTLPKDLKVYLRKKGSTARVLTISKFTEIVGDPCEPSCADIIHGPLEADVPVLAEFGEYAVDVEYTGTQGERLLHEDSATLSYQVRPVFSNLKAANGVSLAQRETVLSGDVQLYDPQDRSRKPYSGGAFTVESGKVTTPLTADAQGHFESKVAVSGAEGWQGENGGETSVNFEAKANGIAKREPLRVPVTALEGRIELDSPTTTGPYATEGKVSGTVTWKAADGTWKPVAAGAAIAIGYRGRAETDGAGRFTDSQELEKDTTWEVKETSPWVSAKSANVKVDATGGTSFYAFKASVDRNKTTTVTGLFNRGEIPAGTTSLKAEVQYSADGKTGWTTRTSVDVPTRPGSNRASNFKTTLPYPGPGFVRMRYAGTPAINGSESSVARAVRTMTAIPEFNAAPEPVKKGKPITVTGKLNHAAPTWKPFAGQTVHYYFRPTGSSAWKVMGYSKTAADGTFAKTFTATQTGSWSARYALADATHFVAASRVDEVAVTP